MIEAGRARAASVGWPDAYAYTKALGEQALTETKGDVPVSIVRPSIIESALAEPRPGWIRGFRMAEPVIISYARGLLKEFPGVPEGTVDVIPVDLVVAAVIAVAALGPERGPRHHPGRLGVGQPVEVPDAGRQRPRLVHRAPAVRQRGPADRGPRVELSRTRPRAGASSNRAKTCIERGEQVLQALPLRGKQAEPVGHARGASAPRSSGRSRTSSSTALYTECEAIYQVDNLLRDLGRPRRRTTRRRSPSTRGSIDWIRVHPATSTCRRWSSTPG